jgi:hypothetical protein
MHAPRTLALALLASTIAGQAQQDGPAIDPAQLLQALKGLKDQQSQQAKTSRQAVLKSAQASAASGQAAAAAWIEAVRETQFQGVEKEGAQFRDWKEKEGALFSEKEVQTAAHLYFRWLTLTTQHTLGTTTKDLLPNIIQYTKDVLADSAAMDALMEHAQKEKDRANPRTAGPNTRGARNTSEDDRVKREHDQILNRALPNSPPVKALHAEELIKVDAWEMKPGDVDGIYTNVILPELRKARDPRVLEYWDMKIKLEGEAVKTKPAFDQDKFTKERRPELLWNRAKEFGEIGLRNKGIAELFQVLRANPQHPKFSEWIGEFETLVSPKPSASSAPAEPAAK